MKPSNLICPRCKASLEPDSNFCDQCAFPVKPQTSDASSHQNVPAKTVKVWHPERGFIDVDADRVQKVKDASKIKNANQSTYQPASEPSFFDQINIIDFAFRCFFFFGVVCPFVGFCAYAIGQSLYHDLGAQQFFQLLTTIGTIVGVIYVLCVLCYLSQVPAKALTFGYVIATFIKGIFMTPIVILGSILIAKAPKGTALAGGIVADMVRDADEVIKRKGL